MAMTDGDKAFVVTTKNLSASGAYCEVGHFFPPMTKFRIKLELPTRPKTTRIRCQGVVVRTNPSAVKPRQRQYHMALFFNDIESRDRDAIGRYVHERLLLSAAEAD
jgi:hypothetical protein